MKIFGFKLFNHIINKFIIFGLVFFSWQWTLNNKIIQAQTNLSKEELSLKTSGECKVKAIYNYAEGFSNLLEQSPKPETKFSLVTAMRKHKKKAASQESKKLVEVKTIDDLSKPAIIYPQDYKHYKKSLSTHKILAKDRVYNTLLDPEKDLNIEIYQSSKLFSPRIMEFYIDQTYGYLAEIGFILAAKSDCYLYKKDFKPFSEDFLSFTQSYLEDIYGRLFLKKSKETSQLNLPFLLIDPNIQLKIKRFNSQELVNKYFSTGKSAKDMFKAKIFDHLQDLFSAELKLNVLFVFYKLEKHINNIQSLFFYNAANGLDLVRELKYYLETNVPPSYVSLTYSLNKFKEIYKENKHDIDQEAARQSYIIAKTIAKKYDVPVDDLVIVVHPIISQDSKGYDLWIKEIILKVYNVRSKSE